GIVGVQLKTWRRTSEIKMDNQLEAIMSVRFWEGDQKPQRVNISGGNTQTAGGVA
ncbi:hypothetical protein RRG08_066110, partial [Elysia crispata]